METTYFLCCRRVIRSAEENDITAVGIYEDLVAQGFPVFVGRLAVVWACTRETAEPNERQGIVRATLNDEQLFAAPITVSFQEQRSTRLLMNFAGLPIPKPGLVRLAILVDGQELGHFSFRISAPASMPEGTQNQGGSFLIA